MREGFAPLGRPACCASSRIERSALCSICSRASAGDMLDEWFENDLVKALFGFDAIVGNLRQPLHARAPPTCCCTTAFGEVNGKKGVWGHAIGGMGAITQAMARVGAQRTASRSKPARPCARCWSSAAAPSAWSLDDGRDVRANRRRQRQSEAALHASWCRRRAAAAISRQRIKRWRNGSGTFRMNVALCALPRFTRAAGRTAIISPPASSSRRASATWTAPGSDARAHGWSREPIVEMLIPSTLDDASRRRAAMSPACSASTSRRSCRTAAPGTIIARRSPT